MLHPCFKALHDPWSGLQAPGVRELSPELAAFCEQALGKPPQEAAPQAAETAALPAPETAPAAADGATADAGGKAKLQNGTGPDVRLSPHTSLESTPFPSTPPGLSHSGVVGSAGSATPAQAVMDPNRAFQAINAETLEQASQDVDYPLPPQNVSSCPCRNGVQAVDCTALTHATCAGARQGGLHREQPE